VEVVASLSQGRTAAAQCGLFTHKSVPVIFEPPWYINYIVPLGISTTLSHLVYQLHCPASDLYCASLYIRLRSFQLLLGKVSLIFKEQK